MKRFYLLSLLFVSQIVWCLSHHNLQLGQYPFDHLQLVQTWPNTFCTTSAPGPKPRPPVKCKIIPQKFTLHGLWPADKNGESLTDNTNCTTDLSGVFRKLRVDLHNYWPSITTWANESFWKAEWKRHGRCSLSNSQCARGAADINIPSNSNSYVYNYNRCDISDKNFWQHERNKHGFCPLSNSQTPLDYYKYTIIQENKTNFLGYLGAADISDIPNFTTPLDYFQFTIDQIKKVDLLSFLEANGTKPDNEMLYSKSDIVEALQPLIGHKNNVSVSCRTRNTTRGTEVLLFEIYICLRENYISCPRPGLLRGCNSSDGKEVKFKFPPLERRVSVL